MHCTSKLLPQVLKTIQCALVFAKVRKTLLYYEMLKHLIIFTLNIAYRNYKLTSRPENCDNIETDESERSRQYQDNVLLGN